jgi:hypothetical protein
MIVTFIESICINANENEIISRKITMQTRLQNSNIVGKLLKC